MRAPFLSLSLVLLAGCTEAVLLGDACRGDAPCVVELDGRVLELPIDARVDARVPDLDARSAVLLDAQSDGGPGDSYVPAPDDAAVWMMPHLENESFDLTEGQPGDVAAVSLPTGTVIAPWFSCQPIGGGPGALTGVRAETLVALTEDGLPDIVTPQDGITFVAMQYFVTLFPPALVQELKTPLRPGTSYGFALFVRTSSPSANLSLQVYGAEAPCVGVSDATFLTASDAITSSGWQRVCLHFSTPKELRYLMLVENAPGALSGDRLFFDDMDSVEECAP
jgi:hypothetical protein